MMYHHIQSLLKFAASCSVVPTSSRSPTRIPARITSAAKAQLRTWIWRSVRRMLRPIELEPATSRPAQRSRLEEAPAARVTVWSVVAQVVVRRGRVRRPARASRRRGGMVGFSSQVGQDREQVSHEGFVVLYERDQTRFELCPPGTIRRGLWTRHTKALPSVAQWPWGGQPELIVACHCRLRPWKALWRASH